MQVSEERLLILIDNAITDAKGRSNGNKYENGVRNGYVKALDQVRFAMTERDDQGGTAHLEVGVSR